jgi:hypothetical protein
VDHAGVVRRTSTGRSQRSELSRPPLETAPTAYSHPTALVGQTNGDLWFGERTGIGRITRPGWRRTTANEPAGRCACSRSRRPTRDKRDAAPAARHTHASTLRASVSKRRASLAHWTISKSLRRSLLATASAHIRARPASGHEPQTSAVELMGGPTRDQRSFAAMTDRPPQRNPAPTGPAVPTNV